MAHRIDRRQLLAGAFGAAAGLAFMPLSRAAAPTGAVTRLGERIALVSGLGGNVVVLTGADGLLLVDSGAPGTTSALADLLRGIGRGGRVATLINTHGHPDQTGSNEAFGLAGVTIIAHEKTRIRLSTDVWDPAAMRYVKAAAKAAWPTRGFLTDGSLKVGPERVDYGHLLQAHTDGDAWIFFRDSNVLAVGDAAAPVGDPQLDWFAGGWLGGRLDSLEKLIRLADEGTRIVAGLGPVISRAELVAEHDVLVTVFDRIAGAIRKGMTWQDMLAGGTLEGLPRRWQDGKKFMYDAHKGFWAHHNTLSHEIV